MSVEHYKIILDVPSRRPALGFNQTAIALKDIIETSDPRFAVGIFGGWGSGKTTLLRTIESLLDTEKVIPVQFSAWRYEKEEHLIVPLLDTVRDGLVKWADQHPEARKGAHKTASTIGKVMKSILAGTSLKVGMPGAMEVSFDANASLAQAERISKKERDAKIPRSFYHASFRALTDAFEEFVGKNSQRRIVVFIDDLDRCLPQGALDVLESMKLFLDLEGFVFVVALDRSVVEWCIDIKYERTSISGDKDVDRGSQIRGSDYIKKIFQVPFTLPPVNVRQLDEFLYSVYTEAELPADQLQEIQEFVEPHLRFLVTDSGVNPREVKRYINGYTLIIKIKPYLDRHAVLALQTISFRRQDWDTVRKFLYAYREIFTNALRRQLWEGEETAVENLNPTLGTIPDTFLRYVETGAPGAALLEITPLDEYIYSGEAVQYSQDTRLLDLIPKVAGLREPLQVLASSTRDDDPRTPNAGGLFDNTIREILSGLKEYLGGAVANRVYQDLEDLRESWREFSENPQEREAQHKKSEELINRTVDRLVGLLQGGALREQYVKSE